MRLTILLLSLVSFINVQSATIGEEKILEVKLSPTGTITIGGDTIAADKLASYIKDRIFKSWAGNGKIYTRIKLTGAEQVIELTREGVITEIKEGQRQALVALCLELYRTEFENLDPKKQAKFKARYPVLFQEAYY